MNAFPNVLLKILIRSWIIQLVYYIFYNNNAFKLLYELKQWVSMSEYIYEKLYLLKKTFLSDNKSIDAAKQPRYAEH